MPIDAFEDAVNAVTDNDTNWWPFLWLRPQEHLHLSLGRMVALAVLYGAPSTAVAGIFCVLVFPGSAHALGTVVQTFPPLFLFVATALIGPMWNRRAARLTRARTRL